MKIIATLLLCLLALASSSQEIPNSNFENWTQFIWTLEPDGWITGNAELSSPVTQDFDAQEGNYAMKVTAVQTGVGAYGEASTVFDAELIPASLDFYVKTAIEFGMAYVSITFYNNENEVYNEFWLTSETLEEWTPISIELDQIEPVLTHASIQVVAEVGDLVPGTAEISVDAMGFETSLSTGKHSNEINYSVFPNPAKDFVQIDSDERIVNASLFNSQGVIVQNFESNQNYSNLKLENLPYGVYLIMAQTESGALIHHRIVVE